jgi:hypothetical protein
MCINRHVRLIKRTDVRRNIHYMACNRIKRPKSEKEFEMRGLKMYCFLNNTGTWHSKRRYKIHEYQKL